MNRKRIGSLLLVLVLLTGLVAVPSASLAAETNHARSATAIASSEYKSEYGIAALNDGSQTGKSRWTADWTAAADNRNEWFGVEFAAPVALDKIIFYEWDSRITEYKVEYKDGEGNWNVVKKNGVDLPNQTKAAKENVNSTHSVANAVTFDLTEVSGIRVYVVDFGKSGVSIWEFEAYNTQMVTADTNLAVMKGTGVADPEKTVVNSGYQANLLNDGSTSGTSRWSSNWGLSMQDVVGCWAGIKFDARIPFDKITVKEYNGRVTKYAVEVSDDGENWRSVKRGGVDLPVQEKEYQQKCTNNLLTYDIEFDRVKAAYVRYRIVEAGEQGPSLWELEVYDSQAGAPFPEVDDEEAFRADVEGVTEQSVLGINADAQNIITDLALPRSPLSGGTVVRFSVTEGVDYLTADGKVTRPAVGAGNQQASLQADFSSPNGTYTDSKTLTFTILEQPEPVVLLQEDYTQMTADTDLAQYNWATYENASGDITSAANGTMGIVDGTLELKKTASGNNQGFGVHKSLKHYVKSYAATGTADETRTAVWSDKLKGIFDVELQWRFSGNSVNADYIDFQGKRQKGSADEYGSLARYKVIPGADKFLAIYNNGSYNGQKESQIYQDTTQTKKIKARFNTITGKFQVYLDGSDTPSDALNVIQPVKNMFEMTDYSGLNKRYYMDRIQFYLAKEQAQNATICIDSFYLAQIETAPDLVEQAAQQLTMDMVCSAPEDVTALETLPDTLAGADISWESSHPNIISNDGATVVKPGVDTDVVLTAAIANPADGFDIHKEFKLTVKAAEQDDENAFLADVNSVTEASLLGNNADAQHVTENLVLPASPMTNFTNVTWSVVSGGNWIDSAGKVTRPTPQEGNQAVQLKAEFSSPQGTYTDAKTFDFTILLYDPEQLENEAFQEDIAGVTETYLLGANADADHIKWSLNLPVSPLPNGTKVTWDVVSGTAISADGKITRPAAQAEDVTLKASFTKASKEEPSETKQFTFKVLPEDGGVWKLVEHVKVEDPRGASTYAVKQITDGVSTSTAANGGVRFGQVTNNEVPSANRPDMKLDFKDKIQPGKKYYIEMTMQADMKKGESRVLMLNNDKGEGALFIFRSGNTLGLAAKEGDARVWLDSKVKINHTHGSEETFGIYYDTAAGTFQFVSNGALASTAAYKPSYSSGFSGVQVSYQGKEGDQDAYVTTKSMKVYEFDAAKAAQIESEFDALDYSSLTEQVPDMITNDLNLPEYLPCGVPVQWETAAADVIGTDGTVTRPAEEEKTVRLTAKIDMPGLQLSKTFDFTVLWVGDKRAGFNEDVASVTAVSLTAQDPAALTGNLTMPAAVLPNGTAVTWTSSDPAVLGADGTVTRPAGRNHAVLLTASFRNGELSAEKTFLFAVLAEGELMENLARGARVTTAAVGGMTAALVDGDYATDWTVEAEKPSIVLDLGSVKSITSTVLYEALGSGIQHAVLEVSKDNISYTKAADLDSIGFGKETRFPVLEGRYVRLRVTQQSGNEIGFREVELYFAPTDEERVKADVKAFTYTNPKVVTADVVLPTETKYGSTLTWTSSNPAAMDAQGHITRTRDNQDVTLTAAFRSGGVEENVLVYHTVQGTGGSNNRPGGSGGGGGSSSGGSGGIGMQVPVVQPDGSPQPTPQPQSGRFKDVAKDRWSYPYIERLAEKGIVDGSGGNFEPEGMLTREQLVKLIVTALEIDIPQQGAAFGDVAEGEWFSPYIAAAAQAGIVSGISETTFGVGQYVSREDMATMICRALDFAGAQLPGGAKAGFTDEGQISSYARDAVQRLAAAGILSGDGGYFLPGDTATREESAKVICMVLDKMGR